MARGSVALKLLCTLVLIILLIINIPPSSVATASGTRAPTEWNQFRGDNTNSGVSEDKGTPTSEMVWKAKTNGQIESSPTVVGGKVFIGSKDYSVYCFSADIGEQKWMFTTGDMITSSPIVKDGKCFIGSDDGKVYCLNAEYGTDQWSFNTFGRVASSPKFYKDKLYFASEIGRVFCVYSGNGTQVWNFTMSNASQQFWSSPAIKDDILYIGDANGLVAYLDTETGKQILNFTVDGDIFTSMCIHEDDIVFATGEGRQLLRYDGTTGEKVWEYDTATNCYTSVAIFNGSVYFSDYEDVISIPFEDPDGSGIITDDEVNWKYPAPREDATDEEPNFEGGSSPLIIGDRLVIGMGKYLCCVFLDNGTEVWNKDFSRFIISSPTYAEDALYIGCKDKHVYCFEGIAEGEVVENGAGDDEFEFKFYPMWGIPIIIFIVLDIVALVAIVIVVMKRKKGGNDEGN